MNHFLLELTSSKKIENDHPDNPDPYKTEQVGKLKTMAQPIIESQSQALGNVDEITQRINTLSALIATATRRKADALQYVNVTSCAEKREHSGRFSRGEILIEAFNVEWQRISDDATQYRITAQAATDNIAFLNKRIASMTTLRAAIIQESIQTENLVRLAVEYKKAVDLLDQAILDRANALKAYNDAEKLIEAKHLVPTLALFDSLCVSLGAQTGTAMLKKPVVAAPVQNAAVPSPACPCAMANCSKLALHPIYAFPTSCAPSRVFCSVGCAKSYCAQSK